MNDKKISFSVKQLVVYGVIPLVIIFAGYSFMSNYQIGVSKKGSMNNGQLNQVAENSPKRIEYQGEKYMLDGDYCKKSTEARIEISVERLYGADPGEGSSGNTMYAIGKKDSPDYIDSMKDPTTASPTRNCWMKVSIYQQ